jgi:hypothetical protein
MSERLGQYGYDGMDAGGGAKPQERPHNGAAARLA